MELALYISLAILLFLIVCGLLAQLEIEIVNEERRHRRLQMREAAYEELERMEYIDGCLG